LNSRDGSTWQGIWIQQLQISFMRLEDEQNKQCTLRRCLPETRSRREREAEAGKPPREDPYSEMML
jgi:hypothetical protein